VSECPILSGSGSPDSPPAVQVLRTEVFRLTGLFSVRSNSVESLDCSTLHGHMTQVRQVSRRTIEDAVRIQPPEGSSLRPDLATRLGGRNDGARRPTRFYTTARSSFWGPRLSSNRRTENAGDQPKEPRFSQYYAEFQVITVDLDGNPSARRNGLQMRLSKEMKNSFTYSDMPEELPAFVTVCQKRDDQIRQHPTEKAVQNTGGGIGFANSRRPPAPPKNSAAAPTGTVAGYTGPAPIDLSAGRRRISAEERAKKFVDGRCLYCGGFNHRAADCTARLKAQTLRVAGAEVKDVRTRQVLWNREKSMSIEGGWLFT